jgi:hypothetical protein
MLRTSSLRKPQRKRCRSEKRMSAYAAPDNILVYLIQQTVDGSPERRLAANFILDCFRRYETREEVEACLRALEEETILDIRKETRQLAQNVGLKI